MTAEVELIRFDLGKYGSFAFQPKTQGGDNPAFYAQQIVAALNEIAERVPAAVSAITGVKQHGLE